MRGVTRYILRQIAGPLALVAAALSGIIWLTQSLRFVERIVNQGLAIESFLYLSFLLFPGVLALVLPIALFCALVYAYHRLATDSELVVLSAAGFSRAALAKPALIVAAAVMLMSGALLLYLAPLGQRTLRSTQHEFRSNLAHVLIREGTFNDPTPGLTVYVRERRPDGELRGILVHDNRDGQRPITMMAERGSLVRAPQGPRLVLAEGNRQQLEENRRQLGLLYFDSYTLDLGAYARPEGQGWREPNERYLNELFWPDLNDGADRQNYWRLQTEGHRRLAALLFAPALALIALAAMLAGEFNRRGRTRRIAAATIAAIALQVIGFAVTFIGAKVPALFPLLYLNPLGFAAGALYVLARPPRPRLAGAVEGAA